MCKLSKCTAKAKQERIQSMLWTNCKSKARAYAFREKNWNRWKQSTSLTWPGFRDTYPGLFVWMTPIQRRDLETPHNCGQQLLYNWTRCLISAPMARQNGNVIDNRGGRTKQLSTQRIALLSQTLRVEATLWKVGDVLHHLYRWFI